MACVLHVRVCSGINLVKHVKHASMVWRVRLSSIKTETRHTQIARRPPSHYLPSITPPFLINKQNKNKNRSTAGSSTRGCPTRPSTPSSSARSVTGPSGCCSLAQSIRRTVFLSVLYAHLSLQTHPHTPHRPKPLTDTHKRAPTLHRLPQHTHPNNNTTQTPNRWRSKKS